MNASLSALINGEKVQGTIACDQPLLLLSGQNSTLRASFNSTPLSFSFDGNGNASSRPFAAGQLQLKAKSLGALLAWIKDVPQPVSASGSVSIDTSVTMSAQGMKMDSLSLSLDDSDATGVLGIAWDPQRTPRIDGTLAFDRLDLTPLLASVFPLAPEPNTQTEPETALLKQISVDLRLSAQEIIYGAAAVTDAAAGIMVENGRASIDIGDGTFADGALSGRIALANDGAAGGQIQLALKNADLAPVAASLGLAGPLPLGRGMLSLDLSTTQPLSKMTADGMSGELRYAGKQWQRGEFRPAGIRAACRFGPGLQHQPCHQRVVCFYECRYRGALAPRRGRTGHGRYRRRRKNLISGRHASLHERQTGADRCHPGRRT